MNRATSPTGWVRNPRMISTDLDSRQASSYELGYTWNPITGCRNHDNGLCKGGGFPCYAYKLANGRLKQRYLIGGNLAPAVQDGLFPYPSGEIIKEVRHDPFYPRFWEERLTPLHIPRKADSPKKGIFVCDMGELFGDWIPRSWQEQIFNAIKANPDYRFYLLTKQPQNLIEFSPFPENCWVGVTATNQDMFDNAYDYLSAINASMRFISLEPLLARIDDFSVLELKPRYIDWVIIGAQTKPYKPPKIEWVREIVEAGIPVFLKDNLEPLWTLQNRQEPFFKFTRPSPGATEIGRLRQEMPT